MSTWGQTLRRLMKAPWFALTAAGSIAIGIAANSALCSYAIDVYWRSLPLAEPERLVLLWETWPDGEVRRPSLETFEAWRRDAKSFEHVGALQPTGWALTDGHGVAERAPGGLVSPELAAVFRQVPRLGRAFLPEDFRAGAPRVAVVSHRFWQRRFGGARDVLGRQIRLNGTTHTVVGVMAPEGSFSPSGMDVTVPLATEGATPAQRTANNKFVLARLAPGVTRAAAQAELDGLTRSRAAERPEARRGFGAAVKPIDEWIGFQPEDRRAVTLLWIAAGGVQLIVCANLASLLLARATARRKELAVRAALGADGRRLGAEFLREALLLAAAGGAAGLVLSFWVDRALQPLMPALPMGLAVHAGFDWRVPLFALVAAVASGALFGVLPAWQAARVNLNEALGDAARGGTRGRGAGRIDAWLAGAEIALACVLLSTAGLAVQAVARMRALPLGFEPKGAAALTVGLPPARYASDGAVDAFLREATARARALPGVTAATVTTRLPLRGYQHETFEVAGRAALPTAERPRAQVQRVGPDYARTLGVPLLRGREIGAGDRAGTPRVAVVNRTLAERWFPGEDPLGRRLRIDLPGAAADGGDWEIVGVLGDVKGRGEAYAVFETIAVPFAQAPATEAAILVRAAGAVEPLAGALRAAVHGLDRDVLADRFETLAGMAEELRRGPGRRAGLLAGFAGVALALAMLGVYGVNACGVAQRTREFGIRMALGAQPGDVLGLVLRQALRVIALGLGAGLALSVAAALVGRSLLTELGGWSPGPLAAAAGVLAAAALLASWIPARRAVRVDPATVLRAE